MSINMEEKNTEKEPLIRVENLKKYYPIRGGVITHTTGYVHSVDGVSFSIAEGETLGLVGESGCGQSTVGRQLVFQDPYSSLNPRKHIYEILSQPMLYHGISNKETVHRDVDRLLDMVGLPKHVLGRYPHEFSGGQRQRIGIARALSLNPRFLVCDEPVSALDVSIQAQILNLLRSLQKDLGLTCMFVGHGLGAVNYVSDRIAVMYLGKIVEIGPAQEVFHHPVHPYTRALIDAVPIADPKKREQKPLLTGEIGSSTNPPSGCRFHPRCPYATESCRQEVPELCSVFPGSSHLAACPYAIAQLAGGAPAYDAKMQQVVVEQKWR